MAKEFLKSNIKVKQFNNGGSVLEIGIPAEELQKCKNGEWINFTIAKRQQPSEKGLLITLMYGNQTDRLKHINHPQL